MAEKIREVVIVGGGISAHTAALYTSRAEMKPLVLMGRGLDQLSTTTDVENYPGFPEGVKGPDLIQACKKQAERFGTTYVSEDAVSFSGKKDLYEVQAGEKTYQARTVIISTGASARTLGVPGEKKYWGKGVSTCAPCDAALFRNKKVVVVGGGDSAMEESLTLTKFATHITIIHRRDEFRASKIMQARVLGMKDKISVVWDTGVTEVLGEVFVKGVKIKNLKTGKEGQIPCDGMFLSIGHVPNTSWLAKGGVELDQQGYVRVKGVSTNLPGVFAAGDVMDPRYKQAVTSAGTGCMAAMEAEKYIELLKATGKYR